VPQCNYFSKSAALSRGTYYTPAYRLIGDKVQAGHVVGSDETGDKVKMRL
jgi:hypothetical protein